jgi:hypothetical protein
MIQKIKTVALRWMPDPVILLIALFNVAFHMAVAGNLEYHRDELLYFSLGMHPSAGYATVPPMVGWLAWLVQVLFGHSVYAVRCVPALMSGLMIIMTARISRELGGKRYSELLAVTGFTMAGFSLRTFGMFMPVFLDVFFWTLCIYMLIRYLNSENRRYLIYFGVSAGFALLNKYLIGIMFAGLLVIVPFTSYRKIFSIKEFWIGIACGLVVFSPNIIWQIIHQLPVINHMEELNRTQLVHVDRVGFLLEQFMIASFASVLVIGGIIFIFFSDSARKFRFTGWLTIFVILSLMLLRGKSYYTLGVYPFLIAAGAVYFETVIKKSWLRWTLPLVIVVITLPSLPMGLPVMKSKGLVEYYSRLEKKYGLVIGRRFEDNSIHSLPQDYADMLGWEELTQVTDSAWNLIADKRSAFIYASNYGQAGAITVIGKKYGLPEAVSFNESFTYWYPKTFDPDILTMVYINNREPGQDVKSMFRKIDRIGSITNPDAREYGTSVYLCSDPVSSFNEFWKIRTASLPK